MIYRTLVTVAALMLVRATAANAQMSGSLTRPIAFGLAAGGAVPISNLGDVTNTGYNVTGILGIKPPLFPIGFRVDASYNAFGYKSPAVASGHAQISSVTGNVVLDMPLLLVHPYLIGGLGYYNVGASSAKSSNDAGFDLGGGVSLNIPLTGISVFAEARYNHVDTSGASTQFTPVIVGVMF
ncbi:MAG TPA: outer membrane beta-barrel protein [Gemmatimonadaceae bacterium]|jgi:hypothetical protein|nr:outer membrane beta-barrel protein [Gemmatimonadaceae bacterium]